MDQYRQELIEVLRENDARAERAAALASRLSERPRSPRRDRLIEEALELRAQIAEASRDAWDLVRQI